MSRSRSGAADKPTSSKQKESFFVESGDSMNSVRFPRVGALRRTSSVPENDQIHHPISHPNTFTVAIRILLKDCLQHIPKIWKNQGTMPPQNFQQPGIQAFQLPVTILLFFILFLVVLDVAVVPDPGDNPMIPAAASQSQRYQKVAHQAEQKLRTNVRHKQELLSKALDSLSTSHLPPRLRELRERHEVVGERLTEIKAGKETVQEILHAVSNKNIISYKPPMELDEIIDYLTNWIHMLHDTLSEHKRATYEGIWQA
jgi:hypothetical protein